jgi:hypothetical protein
MAALIGVSSSDPAGSDASGGSSKVSVAVPLDLLSEDGVPPQQGDSVSFSVDGTVSSADEENATIDIKAVNGQPLTDESAADESAEDPGSSAALKKKLMASPSGGPPAAPPSGMFG